MENSEIIFHGDSKVYIVINSDEVEYDIVLDT